MIPSRRLRLVTNGLLKLSKTAGRIGNWRYDAIANAKVVPNPVVLPHLYIRIMFRTSSALRMMGG